MKKAEGAENRRRERRGQHRRPQCQSQKRNAANGFRFLGRGWRISFLAAFGGNAFADGRRCLGARGL